MQSALELAPQLPLEPAAESTEAQRLQRLAEELLAGRLYLRDEGQRRTAGRLHRQLTEALEAKRARPVYFLNEIARFLENCAGREALTWPQIADARDRSIAPQLAHKNERLRELREVRQWAHWMLDDADLLLLDSETTDLHGFLVEIAITDREGAPVFHSLVNPLEEIDPQAQAVHGITPDELADAPTFAQIEPQLREILWGKTVVIYNAAFDIGILHNELRREIAEQMARAHVPDIAPQPADVERDSLLGMAYSEAYCQGIARSVADTWLGRVHEQCAMEKWAIYVGERSPYHDNYRWQPLDGGHRALDDCRACLALLHRMAAPTD